MTHQPSARLTLEPLGVQHAAAILAGQDDALAEEISGRRWDSTAITEFLDRASRWQEDGPIREFAALAAPVADHAERASAGASTESLSGTTFVGGGGLNLLAPGIDRGQAAMTYWVTAARRGKGWGREIARHLVHRARDERRISQLVLFIAPHNAASQAVARGLGARPEGELAQHPADPMRTVHRWLLDLR
ncbi:GNAT family N-acetyltransferase [Brachybacterium alimentarium]|uniref:GNAT family N-acetyltransferase n=1 Tax=Brachybacterium alimentarium TaxID=47845 RepID=UPI003FCF2261